MPAAQLRFGDFDELRCFGRALVQDERRPLGELVASQLTDQLLRKAMTGVVADRAADPSRTRINLFARFIALHRKHVYKAMGEENDYGWPDPTHGRPDRRIKTAVQSLPLEQREALLLTALSGFSHQDAAEALGISMRQFVDRLHKARRFLTMAMGDGAEAHVSGPWDGAPHLRIVK